MTVIAWDGKTLAVDRRCSQGEMHMTVRKVHKHKGKAICVTGDPDYGEQLVDWYKQGAIREEWPQKGDSTYTELIVFDGRSVLTYASPSPIKIRDKKFAAGSGRAYALAAMELGKTAKEAVKLACKFDPGCGNGIDTWEAS